MNQFDALRRRSIAFRHGVNENSLLDIVLIELLIEKVCTVKILTPGK